MRTEFHSGAAGPDRDLSTAFWAQSDLVAAYADRRELRPVERVLLDRHRSAFSARVLEVGCGAGRITGHLCLIAEEVHGIDVSEAMVRHTADAYPQATISVRDMRDLGAYEAGSFDALLAPFNVIDVLGHEDRATALAGFARVLSDGGLLIFSSHNRGAASSVYGPGRQLLAHLRQGRMRSVAAGIVRFPRRFANHRRLRRLERSGANYSIVNDSAHHYALLHYYVSRDDQERQLAEQGFELIEVLDLDARPVDRGELAPSSSELHYVARRS